MGTMEQSFGARGLSTVTLVLCLLGLLLVIGANASTASAAQDEETFVNQDHRDHRQILAPEDEYLSRDALHAHGDFYESRGFDANFISWAKETDMPVGVDAEWTYCDVTEGARGDPSSQRCEDSNIAQIPIRQSIATGPITVLGDANGFISLACGNIPSDNNDDYDVPPVTVPSISGVKYEDEDADGERDTGEPGLQGWTIELVHKGEVVTTTTTGPDGRYTFTLDAEEHSVDDVPIGPGQYTVREVQQVGWRASETPGEITVKAGEGAHEGNDFGNYQPVEVSGRKFEDMAADGPDASDPGRAGWTITATGPDTASTTTGSDGSYTLDGLTPGTYEVSEQLQPGWEQSDPTSGTYTVTLDSGEAATDRDFGNYQPVEVTGRKFHDLDVNGQDDTEPGVGEWPISISGTESSTTQTAADGAYRITGLTPGQYTISEGNRAGWRQTSPLPSGQHTVTARSGDVLTGNDFGNVCLADLDVTVTDATTGQALDDVEVRLEEVDVTGVLDNDPSLPRTSDGEFTGLLPGDYRVEVFVPQGYGTTDADVELVDGHFAIVEQVSLTPCDDATLATDVVSGSNGKVTGGKWLEVITGDDPSQRANAGFVFMVRHGQPEGNLQFQDRSAGLNLHTKTIDVLVVSGNEAWVWGRWHDGTQQQRFRLHLVDNGEPGGDDVFELSVTPDYTAGFGHTIDGGNIQVHQAGGPPQ